MPRSSASFKPGNTAALIHGNRSTVLRAKWRADVRERMRGLILQAIPEPDPGDLFLIDLLESAMADVAQLRDYLDKQGGPVSRDGRPYKALGLLNAREKRVMEMLHALGLGPRARKMLAAEARVHRGDPVAEALGRPRLHRDSEQQAWNS